MNTKLIRQEIVSRLTGNTAAGTNVYNSKVTPAMANTLPIISVYTPNQVAESLDHRNPAFRRDIDIVIEAIVMAGTNWSDTVDDIMAAVKTALFEDSTWLDNFEDVAGYTEEHDLDDDGEQPIATGTLTLTVTQVERFNANR